jgi:hypothetical protein
VAKCASERLSWLNIHISSVVDTSVNSGGSNGERRYLRQNEQHSLLTTATTAGVTISYNITFTLTELSEASITDAYFSVSSALNHSIVSGAFNNILHQIAAERGGSSSALLHAESSSFTISNTHQPTSETDDNTNDNNEVSSSGFSGQYNSWPIYAKVLFPAGVIIIAALVCLGLWKLCNGRKNNNSAASGSSDSYDNNPQRILKLSRR